MIPDIGCCTDSRCKMAESSRLQTMWEWKIPYLEESSNNNMHRETEYQQLERMQTPGFVWRESELCWVSLEFPPSCKNKKCLTWLVWLYASRAGKTPVFRYLWTDCIEAKDTMPDLITSYGLSSYGYPTSVLQNQNLVFGTWLHLLCRTSTTPASYCAAVSELNSCVVETGATSYNDMHCCDCLVNMTETLICLFSHRISPKERSHLIGTLGLKAGNNGVPCIIA